MYEAFWQASEKLDVVATFVDINDKGELLKLTFDLETVPAVRYLKNERIYRFVYKED